VTDANLVLGRLDAAGFFGGHGQVTIDEAPARRVLQRLGDQLHLSVEAAALGVVRVANATMERALRRVSVERGHDPRAFTLLPFGGAGPLHACDLATSLGVTRILCPPNPGVLSAYGMLMADVTSEASQALLADAPALIRRPGAVGGSHRRVDGKGAGGAGARECRRSDDDRCAGLALSRAELRADRARSPCRSRLRLSPTR
jgi:N-methylhydantoinase A